MNNLKNERLKIAERTKYYFFIFCIVMMFATLISLPRLSVPLGISYLIYLVLNPLVPVLMKFNLPRIVSVLIIFFLFFLFSGYPLVKVIPLIKNEADTIQYYLPKIENYLREIYGMAIIKVKARTGIELDVNGIDLGLEYFKSGIKDFILSAPRIIASVAEWIFIVPLFVYFFLSDARSMKVLFFKLVPNSLFERLYFIFYKFNKNIGDYIFAKVIEASIVGSVILIGLLIMDIRFAFLLGVIAAVTNIIPYLGPILGMVPAVIIGLIEYKFGPTFGAIIILYLVANIIDLALVFPILISKIVDLHPLLVVTSVIVGSQFMGVLGMVISIPMAAAGKLILSEIYSEIYLRHTR